MSAARRKWSSWTTTGALFAAALTVLPHVAEAATESTAGSSGDSTRVRPARTVHEILTSEIGVRRPTGLTYDPDRRTLLLTGALPKGGSEVVAVTPAEKPRGREVRRALDDGVTAAYDPRTDQLRARTAGVDDPAGSTYTPDGTLHVLDAAHHTIVSIAPDGTVDRTSLAELAGRDLSGLAYQPNQHLLYVADTSGAKDTVFGVDASGSVVRTQDISDAKVADLQAMTFAPSADNTDPAAEQSLFVADAGTATTLGRVAELTLAPVAAVTAPTVTGARAQTVDTGGTGGWVPTSPDPSGITYLPGSDRLLISDAEVDEMPIFTGQNLYVASRTGALTGTGTTWPTAPTNWTPEPTGVAAMGSHLLVADDDRSQVHEIASIGADGRWGTADDGARTTWRTSAFGATDAEDVAYDSKRNQILVVDGVNNELFRVDPGPDDRFNGTAPIADDVATHTDLEQYGLIDPEGVVYDAVRDTVVVADRSRLWEIDTTGALLDSASLSPSLVHLGGVTIAPASDGSGKRNYYVVERGVDNNTNALENDGKIYEIVAPLPTIGNRPPAADAGPDTVADVGEALRLLGSGADDGGPNPITFAWSKVSGPGTATFASPSSATTNATFSAAGDYVLRLTVSDSALSSTNDVTVKVSQPGAPRTVTVPIAAGSDDAQEGGGTTGTQVTLFSADDELGNDGILPTPTPMLTGLRFADLPVTPGSQIQSAFIQFGADETGTDAASFTITGEATDNATTYRDSRGNISSRPKVGSVAWAPPAWSAVREAGPAQRTPDLKSIAQAIVNRSGWNRGNAMAFMVSGTGRRTALAFDGGLGKPELVLTYATKSTGVVVPPGTSAPSLSLRASVGSLTAGRAVTLSGTVTRSGAALAGQAVELFATRAPGNVAQRVRTVTTGANGAFSVTDTPSTTTRYVVRGAGGTSPSMSVVVRPKLTAGLSRRLVHRNRAVLVRGSVLPGSSGQRVYLQRAKGTRWVSVKRVVTTSSYRFGLRPTRAGVYRYRVVASANAGRAAATSGVLRLRVLR